MKYYTLCLVPLVSTAAWAADTCTGNATQADVCREATAISESIAPGLPVRLTQGLVLHHVEASKNWIRMSAFFDYTEAYLVSRLRAGVPLDAVRQGVRANAMTFACRPNTQLEAFIKAGGKLQLVYQFADAAHFLTVDVEQCAAEPGR